MPRSKYVPIIIVGLVVIGFVVSVIGTPLLTDWLKYDHYDKSDFIDSDTYQAVFLTNDQIYFGRLKNISSDYLILFDVYYVKINESGAGQLVKLGVGEPHGPKDEMIINQDQVLFWENMRFDSQVVKTIQSMQQK
ncbi:MAG: hypothetical protein A3J47_04235 [Candidatus Yanofskybacteria bacterium RIFCSPHIGHO2_02_FULL_43_22]|uniref:Uncharacterized protein n=1 Tax=Candidatus Yanofskybacteria bacterium RIFCSPHIGHO2_02_FULL_43_22 TaxID=1802681 RepID=A0A1F8FMB1_9BACT|nr:MAG: hypothetical protein A3J47_04235 [Candidatus Yanofskybacteria bacterium RIFCSPHIGHO2_02_FULL_43_22]